MTALSYLLWIVLSASDLNLPAQSWFPKAPPLPSPQGEVIRVSTVDALFEAVETVKPGATILIEEGRYYMPRYLEIRTDGVTPRPFRTARAGDPGRRAEYARRTGWNHRLFGCDHRRSDHCFFDLDNPR